MFDEEKMPTFANLIRLKWLPLDGTKVYKVYDMTDFKLTIVIDNGYDTNIFFRYTDINLPEEVKKFKAHNYQEFIRMLLQKYPDVKQWVPGYPCSEPRDTVLYVTKKDQAFHYTNNLTWGMDDNLEQFILDDGKDKFYVKDLCFIQEMVPHDARAIHMGWMRRKFRLRHRSLFVKSN